LQAILETKVENKIVLGNISPLVHYKAWAAQKKIPAGQATGPGKDAAWVTRQAS